MTPAGNTPLWLWLSLPLALAGCLVLPGTPGAALAIESGNAAPAFEVRDLAGEVKRLSDYQGKIVVLEWTHYGCPFVGKLYHSGKLPAVQRKFAEHGVVWLVVASGVSADAENLKNHEFAKTRRVDGVLLDTDGALARAFGAKTAPHFFVIGPKGEIAYEGALDDNRSPAPETALEGRNYVAEAILAVLAGRTPAVRAAKPYGCAIKYPQVETDEAAN